MTLEIASRLILDAQDYVSGVKAARRENGQISESLQDIKKAANDAEKGLDETTEAVEGLKNEAKQAKPKVDEATESVSRFGKINADAAKKAGKSVAKYAAVAAIIATGVAYAFLDAANQAENYELRLNRLLGSQAEGNRMFRDMAKFAGEVPFAYQEIMGSATQLAGVMKGGVDEVNAWMPIIADLAAVSGLSIEQTTEQVVRMYSAGAGAADLFRERGITAMLGFQAGVSYSAAETQQMLVEAFESPTSKFRGAALDLANSWEGLLSMMGDKWFQFRTNLMDEGIFEYVKELAKIFNEQLGDGLEDSENNAREWANTVMSGMGQVILAGGHLMDFMGSVGATTNLLSNGVQTLYIKYLELTKVWMEWQKLKNFYDEGYVNAVNADLAEVDKRIEDTRKRIEFNNSQIYDSFNKDWSAIAETVIARAEAAAAGAQKANDDMAAGSEETGKKITAAELAELAKRDAARAAAAEAEDKRREQEEKAAEDALKRRMQSAERGLDAVVKATQTEREAVLQWYRESVEALEEAERLKLASTKSYAELRGDLEAELQDRLKKLDEEAAKDRELNLEKELESWSVFGDELFDLYGDLGSVWADLMRGNSDEAKESFDQILEDFGALLVEMALRWALSGFGEWATNGTMDGFTWDTFLGTSGGSNNGKSVAAALAAALSSERGQQAIGQAIGEEAAASLNNGLQTGGNVVGGVGSVVSGYNQIDAGLEQGGTAGALNVASGASSLYGGYTQLMSAYTALTSTGGFVAAGGTVSATAAATEATAAMAASFSEATAAVSALPETISVATTAIESTAVAAETTAIAAESGSAAASSTGSAASGAIGAAAFWAAAAIAVDQIFFDGRAGEAGFKVHDNRKDNLGQTGFTTLKAELYENPKIFLDDLFGARSFGEILTEDYLPELLGNSAAAFSALGADGGTGFAGGNQGVFGNNYGFAGSGLSAQLLVDGGENGNGGFFTGAQESLDAFKEIAEAAGFKVQAANGVLEVMSDTQSVEDIKALWEAYTNGLDETVAASDVFATAYENNLIRPTNLLYENINLATGLNADAAREALIEIDTMFDQFVDDGAEGSAALVAAVASVFELSEEQAAQFVANSGVELEQWLTNFSEKSDEQLREMLDFNEQGLTLFEDAAAATSGLIDGIAGDTVVSFNAAVSGMRRELRSLNGEAGSGNVVAFPAATGQQRIQSFAVGTPRLESDGLVMAHKDEMIIDPQLSRQLRSYGIPVNSGNGGLSKMDIDAIYDLVDETSKLRKEMRSMMLTVRNKKVSGFGN